MPAPDVSDDVYGCVGVLVRVINNMVIIITFWVTGDMKRDEWSNLNFASDPRICIANASAYLEWWQLLLDQCNFYASLERWWASIQSHIAGSDVKIPYTIYCLNVENRLTIRRSVNVDKLISMIDSATAQREKHASAECTKWTEKTERN